MATMINKFFGHNLIREYIIAFGSLFDHLDVVRYNSDGTANNQVTVPLKYGPREKFVVRNEQDPNFSRSFALVYPRMSFEIKGFGYDLSRKVNNNVPFRSIAGQGSSPTQGTSNYSCTPWNLYFNLLITAKSADEANQIVEQILPFFNPDFAVKVNTLPEMGVSDFCSIILNQISQEDTYTGEFQNRRVIEWSLDFTLQARFYGPTSTTPLITGTSVTINGDDTLTSSTTDVTLHQTNTMFVEPHPVITDLIMNRELLNDYGYSEATE